MLQILELEDQCKLIQLVTVLWGIWTARNWKVWENKAVSPEFAMQWSAAQINQWREMQLQKSPTVNSGTLNQQSSFSTWVAPLEGRFKVNVDASVFANSLSYGIGMVLRDHKGVFFKARSVCREGQVSVFEAESSGVLEAIRWVHEMGIQNVTIECDSMLTVQAVNKRTTNALHVGNVLQEIYMFLDLIPHLDVSFIRKQANKVAHALARVPCQVNCFVEFLSPPHLVLENLMYDALDC